MSGRRRALGVLAVVALISTATAATLRSSTVVSSVSASAAPGRPPASPTLPAVADCHTPQPTRRARRTPTAIPTPLPATQPVVTVSTPAPATRAPAAPAPATPAPATPAPSAPAAVAAVPSPSASPPAIAETPLQGLVAPAITLSEQPISGEIALACLVAAAALALLLCADWLVGWNRRPRL